MLLWHGELDTNVPMAASRILAETLTDCDATYFPDDGHLSVIVHHRHEIVAKLAP